MRLLIGTAFLIASSTAFAASIPQLTFPVKNGAVGEVYNMADHPNTVHVFETFQLSCQWCNVNAPAVDRLAAENRANARVQVLDLGLDKNDFEFAEWNRRHSPNHPVVQDVNSTVYRTLKTTNGIPQAFVVDCKGNMVGNVVGSWDATAEKKVRSLIASALLVQCE